MRFKNEWLDAKVVDMQLVADKVLEIKIVPNNGSILPYSPGAHIDISVIINGISEIRSYSLVGKYKTNQPYTIGVKLLDNSRGGSKYMWSLKKGHHIKITKPTNNFELNYNTSDYLLIAAGIGITPLISMAEELSEIKDTNVSMIYVGNQATEMPYIEHLETVLPDNLIVHYSNKNGFYNVSDVLDYLSPNMQAYLCGPLGFMNAIRKMWEQSDYNPAHLRFETFGASGSFAPQAFNIKIPRFGIEIQVPENKSILRSLEDAGIEVMYDCQKGECGLCQIDVLNYTGTIDHRDCFFSEEQKKENSKLCACVSRVANGDLVIDTAYRGN